MRGGREPAAWRRQEIATSPEAPRFGKRARAAVARERAICPDACTHCMSWRGPPFLCNHAPHLHIELTRRGVDTRELPPIWRSHAWRQQAEERKARLPQGKMRVRAPLLN